MGLQTVVTISKSIRPVIGFWHLKVCWFPGASQDLNLFCDLFFSSTLQSVKTWVYQPWSLSLNPLVQWVNAGCDFLIVRVSQDLHNLVIYSDIPRGTQPTIKLQSLVSLSVSLSRMTQPRHFHFLGCQGFSQIWEMRGDQSHYAN